MTQLAANVQAGPVLAPSQAQFLPGKNRFGFGLFDRSRKQITDAPGALYVARSENSPARGPYVARWESLEVKGHYLSKTVATSQSPARCSPFGALAVSAFTFGHRSHLLWQ